MGFGASKREFSKKAQILPRFSNPSPLFRSHKLYIKHPFSYLSKSPQGLGISGGT
jgi:hypothetical protein